MPQLNTGQSPALARNKGAFSQFAGKGAPPMDTDDILERNKQQLVDKANEMRQEELLVAWIRQLRRRSEDKSKQR